MTASSPLIVIFGAALRPDGSPSDALVRRISYGLAAARLYPEAPILCSGGAVRPGPSEASAMAAILGEAGIASERLILDELSLNTRQNVEAAVSWARGRGHTCLVICSDAYHLPRIRLLLGFYRMDTLGIPFGADTRAAPLGHRIVMSLRETLAITANLAMLIVSRMQVATGRDSTSERGC